MSEPLKARKTKMIKVCPICEKKITYSHKNMFNENVYYCPEHGKIIDPQEDLMKWSDKNE